MARQMDLYSRWSLEVRRSGVFPAGGRVGVAVSGGQDSMLLLRWVSKLARETGFRAAAVHFNHRLRGDESDADERFVRHAAGELDIEFFHAAAEVESAARAAKKNLEATARELRYRYFFSLIRQGKLDRIATAHTANDQAETVLLRLLRGAGSRGLAGIFPALEGGVVRPFLGITRAEVEAEVIKLGLTFRVDRSNLDLYFSRNRIRHQLLPILERDFNPRVVEVLSSLAARCRDEEAYLEAQSAEFARPWRIREGGEERISIRALTGFPAALQRRVLRQMAAAAGGKTGSLTAFHVDELRHFCAASRSGKVLLLPGGLEATRQFDWLAVRRRDESQLRESGFFCAITPPGEARVPGGIVRIRVIDYSGRPALKRTYNGSECLLADFAKLAGEFAVRNPRPGDRFRPLGHHKSKKLKELFLAHKIPGEQRHNWPLLVSGGQIVWVRGFGTSGSFAVSPGTRRVLVIEDRVTADRMA